MSFKNLALKFLSPFSATLFVVGIPSLLNAETFEIREFKRPVSEQEVLKGFENYPVMQCPRPSKITEDILGRISEIKSTISKEANCKEARTDVDKLQKLAMDDRENVVSLIKKGRGEGLSVKEAARLKNAIAEITVAAGTLLRKMTGNDVCFEEDRKVSSMAFLSDLIGAGAQLLSLVDPSGGMIGLAGNAITGFVRGLIDIKNSRIGFDFSKRDQVVSYNKSLCSYFDFKVEVEAFLLRNSKLQSLEGLEAYYSTELLQFQTLCSKCSEFISYLEVASAETVKTPTGLPEWTDEQKQKIKDFVKNVNQDSGGFGWGNQVLEAFQHLTWVQLRIATIEANKVSTDTAALQALGDMIEIEDFLLNRQADSFLKSIIASSRRSLTLILDQVRKAEGELRRARSEKRSRGRSVRSHVSLKPALAVMTQVKTTLRGKLSPNQRGKLLNLERTFDLQLQKFISGTQLVQKFCQFFQFQGWYPDGVSSQCQNRGYLYLVEQLELISSQDKKTQDLLGVPKSFNSTQASIRQSSEEFSQDWLEAKLKMISSVDSNKNP